MNCARREETLTPSTACVHMCVHSCTCVCVCVCVCERERERGRRDIGGRGSKQS